MILDCLTLQSFLQPTINPSFLHARFHLCTVDQAEDVVENEVAALAIGLELEGLSVVHGPLLLIDLHSENLWVSSNTRKHSGTVEVGPYQKSTSDHDQDTTLLVGGLSVEGRDLVSDLGEGKALGASQRCSACRYHQAGEHTVNFSVIG